MKNETHEQLDKPQAKPKLSVEVKVREVDGDLDATADGGSFEPARQDWLVRALVLGAVLLIAGIFVGTRLTHGWVPADDGILAQGAVRVFQGQLPHRDFAEIYTGGLNFIHAGAFRIFGVSLRSLRICVFLFFLAWIPAVYYVALRFTSAVSAGAITLLAVAWSFPNYPAAMPSWYNLFLATFGAAALLRYLDVRRRRWLFIAGVCGGVSILIKVIGAYYIAGVLLFLAFLEQSNNDRRETNKSSWGYRAFSVSALMAFMGTLFYLVHARLTTTELYHFVLPSAAIVVLIVVGERNVKAGSGRRFGALVRSILPFVGGVAAPIVVFLTPYALSRSIGSFFSGVMGSAASHVADLAVIRPAPIQYAAFVLPLGGLLAAAMYWDKFQGKAVGGAIGLGAIVLAVRATQSGSILSGVWFSVVTLTPVVVVLGAGFLLAGKTRDEVAKMARQRVALLTCLAAACTLVQYPFAAPIYLCYALPLTILALVAIVTTAKKQSGTFVLASVVGFYLAFGTVCVVPLHLAELTHVVGHMDELEMSRGGIQIEGAPFFEDLARILREHSPNGLMFAGNDCPELYFLSGLKGVTRSDGGAPDDEILRALQSDDLKLVVLNDNPFFPSGRIGPTVRAEVLRKFPNHGQAGIFQIFWRE